MIKTRVPAPEHQVWASVMPIKYVYTEALPPRQVVAAPVSPMWTLADAAYNTARGWTND